MKDEKRTRERAHWTSDFDRLEGKVGDLLGREVRYLDGRLYLCSSDGRALEELIPGGGRVERRDAYHILTGVERGFVIAENYASSTEQETRD